ncbi:MAG: hypothetical protein JNM22_23395 [Saprospiraceae bacterium]|nr:hypothetical protein [Saprospiraceae bacterium]
MGFRLFQHLSTTRALQIFQLQRLGAVVLTSVIFAKSGLAMVDIGAYEMLLYLGTMFTFLWVNGLLQGIPPVYVNVEKDKRNTFLFNVFLVFFLLSLLLFAVMLGGKQWVVPFFTGQSELPYFTLFCFYLLLNVPTLPVEYVYLLREQPAHILWWGSLTFGLQVGVFFVPIWMGWGLLPAFQMLVILAALKFLWACRLFILPGSIRIDIATLRYYLRFSGPLIANLVVGNLILLFDNWLVGWYYHDAAVFAIYRYGSREFPLATALATALATSMIPGLIETPEKGMEEMKKQSLRLMHVLFPVTIVLMFVTKPLFPLIFNHYFEQSASLFNIYLLLTASRVLLPNAIVLAKGYPSAILRVGILELILKIILGFVLIKYLGLPGLAISVILAFWMEKIALIWFLEKKQGIRTSRWLDVKWYMVYVFFLIVAFFLSTWQNWA